MKGFAVGLASVCSVGCANLEGLPNASTIDAGIDPGARPAPGAAGAPGADPTDPPAECQPPADGGAPCDGGTHCQTDVACDEVPTGGEGQLCGPNDACDPGLFCIFGPGNLGGVCLAAGGEDQACLPLFECNAGLFCITGEPTGPRCRPPGEAGARCTNESCSEGLICSYADLCPEQQDYPCCLPAGGEGEACEVGGVCDAGLVCGNCQGFMEGCCLATGGEGERCGVNNTCDPGLICVFGPGNPLRLCQAAGGEGEACLPGSECDVGLFCIADDPSGPTCHPPGVVGERCTGESCSAGLVCAYADLCPDQQDYACCLAAGGEGEACDDGDICDAGLECGGCEGFMNGCCVPASG